MRAILFLFLVLCMGFFAQAQNTDQPKVETITMPIAHSNANTTVVEVEYPALGVFVLKNSRVKRALTFKTRKKDAKLV